MVAGKYGKRTKLFSILLVLVMLHSGCSSNQPSDRMISQLVYDASGRTLSAITSGGQTIRLKYNGEGLPIEINYPGETIRYGYDAMGNRAWTADRTGTNQYFYTAFGQLEGFLWQHGIEKAILYSYDTRGNTTGMDIYDIGGMKRDPHFQGIFQVLTAQTTMDAKDRSSRESAFKQFSQALQNDKDEAGKAYLEYSASYAYDALEDLVEIKFDGDAIEFAYDYIKGEVVRTLPNDIISKYSFTQDGGLGSLSHIGSGKTIASYSYDYDAAGMVTKASESGESGTQTAEFDWNPYGGLNGYMHPDGTQTKYAYDSIGNLVSEQTADKMIQYAYDGFGRIAQAGKESFNWDNNNNMTAHTVGNVRTVFTYYSSGLLQSIKTPEFSSRYTWDGDGNLFSSVTDNQTTYYLPNPLAPGGCTLAEFGTDGSLKTSYLYGDSLLGQVKAGNGTQYFLEDGFGSIKSIADDKGHITGQMDYTPFAEPFHAKGSFDCAFRTAGERLLEKTDLCMIGSTLSNASFDCNMSSNVGLVFSDLSRYSKPIAFGQIKTPDIKPLKFYQKSLVEKYNDMYNELAAFRKQLAGKKLAEVLLGSLFQENIEESNRYRDCNLLMYHLIRLKNVPLVILATEIDSSPLGMAFEMQHKETDSPPLGKAFGMQSDHADTLAALAESLLSAFTNDIAKAASRKIDQMLNSHFLGDNSDFACEIIPYFQKIIGWSNYANEVESKYALHDPMKSIEKSLNGISADAVTMPGILPGESETAVSTFVPPPPFPTDGPGLGGISISPDVQFSGDLANITGAVYDPQTQLFVLLSNGKENQGHGLSIKAEDLAVALKLVYGDYPSDPSFTFDPYDTSDMNGEWLRAVYIPGEILEGTSFGKALFDADYLLKQYGFGIKVDEETGEVTDRISGVEGFKSMADMYFENPQLLADEATWVRQWITAEEVKLIKSDNSVTFGPVTMRVNAKKIVPDPNAPQGYRDVDTEDDPLVNEYTKLFTKLYDQLAQESPEFERVRDLTKAMALAKWMKSENIPIDMGWVEEYAGRHEETPEKIPTITHSVEREKTIDGQRYILTFSQFGGVDLSMDPKYEEGGTTQDSLEKEVISKLNDEELQSVFTVEDGEDEYTAIILPLTKKGQEVYASAAAAAEDGASIGYDFNDRNQLIRGQSADGGICEYGYDRNGELENIKISEPTGWHANVIKNDSGSTWEFISPKDDAFLYTYDASGNLSKAEVNGKPWFSMAWSKDERKTVVSYEDYTKVYDYDEDSNLSGYGIELDETSSGGTKAVYYSFADDGKLSEVTADRKSFIRVVYDDANDLLKKIVTPRTQIALSYSKGELSRIAYGKNTVSIKHQNSIDIVSVMQGDAEAVYLLGPDGLVSSRDLMGEKADYGYDSGKLASIRLGNGAEVKYTYDDQQRISGILLSSGRSIEFMYSDQTNNAGVTSAVMVIVHPEPVTGRGE